MRYNGAMIRRLSGTIVDALPQGVVLDVGGVGYFLFTNQEGRDLPAQSPATFYTHHSVRETALDLYGFLEERTLRVFEILLSIPKIGPRSALQILDQADTNTLVEAGRSNDAAVLIKLSGIGKKTAERIVAGLNEKAEELEPLRDAAAPPEQTEALDTLVALGYSPQAAREALKHIDQSGSLNEQVKEALRYL